MRVILRTWMFGLTCLLTLTSGCANRNIAPTTKPAPVAIPATQAAVPARAATTKPVWAGNYHLHLPGIGGYRNIDRSVLRGLKEGDVDGQLDHYDWAAADPGLGALLARKHNTDEAANVAQIILEHYRANPKARISISAHSGGAGIIAWALEILPADVQVDTVVLLAPALSPTYDLTKALQHVRGHVYVFYSDSDAAVLGIGTSLFGTIDGVKTEAAGKVGFKQPPGADQVEYRKLVQIPHQREWIREYDNLGDHIGTMNRFFSRAVIAPLILTGKLPPTHPAAGADSEGTERRDRASSTSPAVNTK